VSRLFAIQRAAHASPIAVGLLILANLFPLAGVLFLGWELPTLLAAYWAENGVIGVFAIGRILTAAGTGPIGAVVPDTASTVEAPPPPPPPRSIGWQVARPPRPMTRSTMPGFVLVPFFAIHYGIFWVVHGVFVWAAFPFLFAGPDAEVSLPDPAAVLGAAVVLAISHGASFLFNWLGGGEYRVSSPTAEMAAPYARVIVLHLTIIFGAFAVSIIGAPIGALVVMVALKTGIDLSAHLGERQRAAGRLRAGDRVTAPGAAGA
jgi:hypothetical protein